VKTERQTPRRQGAKGRVGAAAALLAVAFSTLPTPAVAQRLPERFGPPQVPGRLVTIPRGREARAGAAALRPALRDAVAPAASRGDSGLTAGVFVSEVVAGAAGAVLGFYGGARLGGRSCDFVGSCGGEDPGLGRAILGALAGSWLGTALGSHVGGGIAGGPTGSLGARLLAAAGGTLAAIGAAMLVHTDLDRPATWIPLPVVAAAVTSLAVPRR
jgi:hypothetical protein